MGSWQNRVDAQARWVANWLRSRSAFITLVYGTVLWIPFVVLGLDPHGFLYLYIATSLSLVTQVPLAMLAYWASREAESANIKMHEGLAGIHAIGTATQALVEVIKDDVADHDEILEDSEKSLQEIVLMGKRALKVRELRENLLKREGHMHTVLGLVRALEAGLKSDEEGLPAGTRAEIYEEIIRQFDAWNRDRDTAENLLRELDPTDDGSLT